MLISISTWLTLTVCTILISCKFEQHVHHVGIEVENYARFKLMLHHINQFFISHHIVYLFLINGSIIWQATILRKAKQVSTTTTEFITIQQHLYDKIKQHKQDQEVIEHMAYHDALTNIGNRRYFEEVFNRNLNLALLKQSKCALLSMDLNKFKPINDLYGHAVGDA